jgi:hypothetical protein
MSRAIPLLPLWTVMACSRVNCTFTFTFTFIIIIIIIMGLCIEIKRMWNMKCVIIPVLIGATGRKIENLKKNLEAIARKHSTDSMHKTAILGTPHIIRKELQSETGNLSGGDRRCFERRSAREKRPVTREDDDDDKNKNNRATK